MDIKQYLDALNQNYRSNAYGEVIDLIRQFVNITNSITSWREHFEDILKILIYGVKCFCSEDAISVDDKEIIQLFNYFIKLLDQTNNSMNVFRTFNVFSRRGMLETEILWIIYVGKNNYCKKWLNRIIKKCAVVLSNSNPSAEFDIFKEITKSSLIFVRIGVHLSINNQDQKPFNETRLFLENCKNFYANENKKQFCTSIKILLRFIKCLETPIEVSDLSSLCASFGNHNNMNIEKDVWSDTAHTLSQYIRLGKLIIMSHVTENNISILLDLVCVLLKILQLSNYNKLCKGCKQNGTVEGSSHEIKELGTFAMHLFKKGIQMTIIEPSMINKFVELHYAKLAVISRVSCKYLDQDYAKEKALLAIEQIAELCENDESFDIIMLFFRQLLRTEFSTTNQSNSFRYIDLMLKICYKNCKWPHALSIIFTLLLINHKHLTLTEYDKIGKLLLEALKQSKLILTPVDFHKNSPELPSYDVSLPNDVNLLKVLSFYSELLINKSHLCVDMDKRIRDQTEVLLLSSKQECFIDIEN